MSSENSIQSEIYRQLIRHFLSKLAPNQRDALGDEHRIRVAFVEGDQEAIALAERSNLVISPSAPVLHVRAESRAHEQALALSYEVFCQAAAAVGFNWLSFACDEAIDYAFRVKP
jgi:hypothetical protein